MLSPRLDLNNSNVRAFMRQRNSKRHCLCVSDVLNLMGKSNVVKREVGAGDVSAGKSFCCSCGGPEFRS